MIGFSHRVAAFFLVSGFALAPMSAARAQTAPAAAPTAPNDAWPEGKGRFGLSFKSVSKSKTSLRIIPAA